MARVISIGNEEFSVIREKNSFYIDKTGFIKEWWENEDVTTLITRPRRFGKTLNMTMLNCFFSNKYKGRADLFYGLDIWKEEKYRNIQGTYPVIFLSFARIKANTFEQTKKQMYAQIVKLYEQNRFLLDSECMSDTEKARYKMFLESPLDKDISFTVNDMSDYLSRYYGRKVIILLDEYDTPMQEAYVNGYWEKTVAFTRSFFNATFKTNPFLERAIMTGITRVSKESIFSDLNNLVVVTSTSKQYETVFGFTEEEVFSALDEFGLAEEKLKVKDWYDGFIFGNKTDIYNPWSIINFLKFKEFNAYWADSSSNGLVNRLIRTGASSVKQTVERLIDGDVIEKSFDEQIVYDQLDRSENAIWSLLLASGYLRVETFRWEDEMTRKVYGLKLTNKEVEIMFKTMISGWFECTEDSSENFIKALISGNLDAMNEYMNEIALETFSSFDVAGKENSRVRPENLASCYDYKGVANGLSLNDSSNLYAMTRQSSHFYHGFVLGLIVNQSKDYIINSNRESGFGRYDVMMMPKNHEKKGLPAIIIEFKVINPRKESSLKETVDMALKQIKEKNYDAELIKRGVKKEDIRHYGFAFRGKEVLIGEG